MNIELLNEIFEEINVPYYEYDSMVKIDSYSMQGLDICLMFHLEHDSVRVEAFHHNKYSTNLQGLGSFLSKYEIEGISEYDLVWSELKINLTNPESVKLIQTIAEEWYYNSSLLLNVNQSLHRLN